jgi:hypothetical protein|tara:strand:+ start:279 stop:443 length:165 start_codon:yes stop_codon:yes gene_type:complete
VGSIMEMFGILFILVLSFVFHCVVYEDDYIKKWYWKILIGSGIIIISIAAIMGY